MLSMTAEMEFIKLFPYLSGLSTTSPHDMDNLLDELSLDVAEVTPFSLILNLC